MSHMQQILASMQSSQWYDHFRGALYPFNLEECRMGNQKKQTLKSLMHIAADFIVRDSSMTLTAVSVLPWELCTVLMQEALEGNRDRAIDVLLTKWPLACLSLKKFAPNIFTDLRSLHDSNELTHTAKQGLRYTTSVAHNFLETLKKKCETKLKYVDMTGYPTAEVITYYLATHCMLAHNEAKQNMMIRKYEEAIKLLPDKQSLGKLDRFTADQSLPDDSFAVKFDVFLTSEHSHVELCKALKVSGFKDSTLKLIVEKLDVTCLGCPSIMVLLEQVNIEYLVGLRLRYNSLGSAGFMKLSPLVGTFKKITSLDLSCNNINIFQNAETCDSMADMLGALPNLVRIDLSNNRLKSKLRQILSCIEKPLQYLRLVACGLSLIDISYLSLSHHTAALQELDLSENGLANCLGTLLLFLQKLKHKLCVLELENTSFKNIHLNSLGRAFRNMNVLLYLNVRGNSVLSDSYCQLAESVAGLTDLQYVCMSYPRDCYTAQNLEAEGKNKQDFEARIRDVIFREQERLQIKTRIPNLVFSELDQEMDVDPIV